VSNAASRFEGGIEVLTIVGRTYSHVMAGHSPSKTGVAGLLSPAIHILLLLAKKNVDARHKAGHDGVNCRELL
jgi:hypothetical protein